MPQSAFTFSAFILLLMLCKEMHAQKTDKVFLKNGDMVTGEIKSLKLAKLSFDMNGPGIISIKWTEVVRIRSDKIFQVIMQEGELLVTKLDSAFFSNPSIRLDDMIEIVQIRHRFIKRLSGDINLGFTYAKSSEITQFNLTSSTTYRVPKIETNLKLNTLISRSSGDTLLSKKQDATIGVLRTLDKRYYIMSNLGWEENTELGLENRYLLAAGTGKILVNDNQQRLLTGFGLAYNQEETNEKAGYTGNLEGRAIIQYKRFRYTYPTISIDAEYILYPSLTDWGRIRMNFQLYTSIEIFRDFSAGLTFYDTFDNQPSSGAASQNDFGITFTLGYKFGK